MSEALEIERADACVEIIHDIWRSLDKTGWTGRRAMGIYDELAGRIRGAARASNIREFHARLARAFGVQSTRGGEAVMAALQRSDGDELLKLFRREAPYIIMLFRAAKDGEKEARAAAKATTNDTEVSHDEQV